MIRRLISNPIFLGAIVGVIVFGFMCAVYTFVTPLPDCSLIDPSVSDSELQQNEKTRELEECNSQTRISWTITSVFSLVGFFMTINVWRLYNEPSESP